jgi:Opioid growth factor receptor (OGFr) conserved region
MAVELIAFFDGLGGDYRGRTLSSILQWPDEMLEYSHDYIQTLFPIPERSAVSQNATIINREVFEAFHTRPELRSSLRMAFKRILSFYGLKLIEDKGNMRVCPIASSRLQRTKRKGK